MAIRHTIGIALGAACSFTISSARATSLRCGDRIASKGDTTYEVQSSCGEPVAAQQRVVRRSVQHHVPVPCPEGSRQRYCSIVVEEVVEVSWTNGHTIFDGTASSST